MAYALSRRGKQGVRHTGMYRGADGKPVSCGTFSSKAEALARAEKAEQQVVLGVEPSGERRMTVAEYMDSRWIEERRKELGGQTADRHPSRYKRIKQLPVDGVPIGDRELRKLTPRDIQGFVNALKSAGLAPRTVKAIYDTLRTVLVAREGTCALRDGLLPQGNPCVGIRLPKAPEHDGGVLEPHQEDALMAAVAGRSRTRTRLRNIAIVATAIETGLRYGELAGLRVRDVDLDGHRVVVRGVVERYDNPQNSPNGKRLCYREYTKGWLIRSIDNLTPELMKTLAALIEQDSLSGDDHLFRTRTVPMMSSQSFSGAWERFRTAAGLEDNVTIHDLRATNITWMLAGGTDVLLVKQRAGHADLSTTNKYARRLASRDQTNAAAALARVRGK